MSDLEVSGGTPGRGPILLVEDSDWDARRVESAIEGIGTAVHRVSSMRAARAAIRTLDPAVMVLDLSLDDCCGEETMRAGLLAAEQTPVIVMAGSDEGALAEQALSLGAHAFCVKTPDMSQLARTLRSAMERRSRPEEMNRTKQNLLGVLDGLRDGAVVVDGTGEPLYWNQVAARLLRIRRGQRGRDFAGQLPTWPGRHRLGPRMALVEVSISDVEWDETQCSLLVLRDLRDVERLQQLRNRLAHSERLRALGTLAAGIAHEINNPGQSIHTNLHVAREICEDLVEHFRNAPNAIEADVEMLAEILDDCDSGMRQIFGVVGRMRRFSRVESEPLARLSLADLVHEAMGTMRHAVRPNVFVDLRLEGAPEVVGDWVGLTQVVTSLATNALEAMALDGDQHRLTIRCTREGHRAVLAVSDTGPGIPAAQLKRIGDPFYTTKSRDRGTGLGLALCNDILERHGGSMHVTSTVGEGSTFEVRLPLVPALTGATSAA